MTKGFEKCINQITKTGNYKSEEKNGVVEVYYHNTVILAYDKTKKSTSVMIGVGTLLPHIGR